MLLALGANASDPAIEPNSSIHVVAYLSKPLAWIFRAQLLPESRVVLLIDSGESLFLHRLADVKRFPFYLVVHASTDPNRVYRCPDNRRASARHRSKKWRGASQ